jgi:universal stress protein A
MIKRILVPVDFSDPSLQALDYAIELGRRLKAELIVLHAVEPVYYPTAGDISGIAYDVGLVYQELERAGHAQLSRLAATLRARRVAVRALLLVGTAHRVITETAKKLKADLIVMSTHGRTGLLHVLMGSVAERVVRTAVCPVMTVRAHRPGTRRQHARPAKRAAIAPRAR